jgi:hypothetical protein
MGKCTSYHLISKLLIHNIQLQICHAYSGWEQRVQQKLQNIYRNEGRIQSSYGWEENKLPFTAATLCILFLKIYIKGLNHGRSVAFSKLGNHYGSTSFVRMTYLQLDVEQQSFYKSWVFDNYVIIYPVSNYIPWISCVIWHMSVCYEHERKSVRNLNKIKFLQCRMTLYYNLLSFCQ